MAFFEKLIQRENLDPSTTAYVGDRFENDILPAQLAGLMGILLRRGPWGYVNEDAEGAAQADRRIASLVELSSRLPAVR